MAAIVAITTDLRSDGAMTTRGAAQWARLRRSRAYDIAMRLPLLLWCGFLGISAANDLMAYAAGAADAPPALYAVNIAMRLSLTGFFVVLLASIVLRGPALDKAQGIEPRLSALLGTLLITAIAFLPRRDLSPALGALSTGLILSRSSSGWAARSASWPRRAAW